MPARGQQQQRQQPRAVVAQGNAQQPDGATRALQVVTQEIDKRLALVAALGVNPDRMKLVMLTTFTRTPSLWTCNPVSVARAMTEAAELGLEPTGLMGGAYLVPRGGQATLLVGYRGLVMLAKRSGEVQRVEARVVREKDQFSYAYGLDQHLTHVPSNEPDPGRYIGAYAVIFYRDGSRQFDYMSYAEIEDIRKRSGSPDQGPWVTDWPEMAKKTPLRRLMKMAPLTVQVAARLDELDPEVVDNGPTAKPDAEQARMRAELQRALEAEYGGTPPALGTGATTQATGAGTPGGQAGQPAEGGSDGPPGAAPQAGQEQAAGGGSTTAAAPASKPESVAQITGQVCGAVHEGLGSGPCVLPPHEKNEHQDASGIRYSMPQRK